MTLISTHHKKPIKPTTSINKLHHLTHSTILTLLLSMACLLTFSLLLLFSLSTATTHHRKINTPALIQQACKATRFQLACEKSLSVSHSQTPLDIIQSSIKISLENLKTGQNMVQSILDSSKDNINRTLAAKNCLESLANSAVRIGSAAAAADATKLKDSRMWMSASLAYQYDCWSGMKYANDTSLVGKTMLFFNDTLVVSTSNALSLLFNYDVFGDKVGSWIRPVTERDGFWEVGGGGLSQGSGFRGGVPGGLKPDVVVCKDGNCGYKSVQEAVDSAPSGLVGKRFVIYIKEGVYDEIVRVGLDKKNLVFLGDGMGKTVITGSMNVRQPGVSTYNTATVGVLGDGFMASGLTIQNTAGPDAHQAVAFRSDSDLSVIENCEFLGNQDTLYAHSLRQFYKGCRIEGNVDFIFGNAAALFQDCQILVRPRQLRPEKGENNAVTAHGRTDPAQSTGFVFQNCLINGTEDYMKLYASKPKVHKNFLGRPWKEFARTVFIHCNFEALVTPQGWMPWTGDFALKTLYYGEFENSGPGASTSQRVPWSSQIPSDHVLTYSVQNFIQGTDWIPPSSK